MIWLHLRSRSERNGQSGAAATPWQPLANRAIAALRGFDQDCSIALEFLEREIAA